MVQKKVSRAQVALRAGVSPQTVSRVSNNEPNVKKETRERVLKVIRELGYQPNRAARALKYGSFSSVGIVLFDVTERGNALTLKGIVEAATEGGYITSMMVVSKDDPIRITDYLARMHALSVDATIVVLEKMPEDLQSFSIPAGMNVVLISPAPSCRCRAVDANQGLGTQLAVNHLLEHGHPTVYFLAGPKDSLASAARQDAWRNLLLESGRRVPEVLVGDWSADSGYQAGLKLAKDPQCTAIFAANDTMANGVIEGLKAGGRRVPEDVSVVGFDDSLGKVIPNCPITTIRQDFSRIGRTAFRVAIDDLSFEELGGESEAVKLLQIPVELIQRHTVAHYCQR